MREPDLGLNKEPCRQARGFPYASENPIAIFQIEDYLLVNGLDNV